jgi:hypothetical protein
LLAAVVGCLCVLAFAGGGVALASGPQARPATAALTSAGVMTVPLARPLAHPATALAVTKFLLHAGIAYYVFDHYIYKPWKAGELHGFTHVLTIAKAGLAALFVYHELKVMAGDVKDSKLLTFLTAPIALAITKLSALKSAITGGNLNAIGMVEGELGSIKQQAGSKGILIKEIVHAL